jgi:hypothetical protein
MIKRLFGEISGHRESLFHLRGKPLNCNVASSNGFCNRVWVVENV